MIIALVGVTSSAFAQVDYVRELSNTSFVDLVIASTQAPLDVNDPYYINQSNQEIFTAQVSGGNSGLWYRISAQTGAAAKIDMPVGVRYAPPASGFAIVGQGTDRPFALTIDAYSNIVTYDLRTGQSITEYPTLFPYSVMHSIASLDRNQTAVSVIADSFSGTNTHYIVDFTTGLGEATSLMDDLDRSQALYQSYAPDGSLYVLDYGNARVVSFDPTNNFEQIGEFNLQTGLTTANVQFAIGRNGNFYMSDGLGGGSTYAADGTFLNSFALPNGVVGDPYTGASYISTDAAGRVYVYDSETGFHQYQDTSIVPEPATWALLVLGGLGAFLLRLRGQKV